jgi:CheY-like chemotaxis protein
VYGNAHALVQLVDLMHGAISLQSKLDQGTIATFSVPFNKPQFQGATVPLVDLGALPDRFHSELSCTTSSRGANTNAGRTSPPLRTPAAGDTVNVDTSIHQPVAGAGASHVPLTEAQKKEFHVLVVEDNAINQQIALKTIRNMGFSVSAVWNGKEALDYLLQATATTHSRSPASSLTSGTTPTNKPPLPNVILMDVQMPVLDGYRATHTLRHHAPFKNIQAIQKIPIVAMTASAIQGDREKCQRAGMDDYISKPTPRNKLEQIILKWAEGAASLMQRVGSKPRNSKTIPLSGSDIARCGTGHSSDCPGSDYPSLETGTSSTVRSVSPSRTSSHTRSAPHSRRPHLPSSMSDEKVNLLLTAGDPPSTLSEADRGLRRAEAEEQAANLRDEKLFAATGSGSPYPAHEDGSGARAGGTSATAPATNKTGGLGSSSPLLVNSSPVAGIPFVCGAPPSSGAPESYSDQRAVQASAARWNIMALTEENVERFNSTTDKTDPHDATSMLEPKQRTAVSTAAPSTRAVAADLDVAMDVLASPPIVHTVDDDDDDDDNEEEEEVEEKDDAEKAELMRSSSSQALRCPFPPLQPAGSAAFASKTRGAKLSEVHRSDSDWSQSTARPGKD